jgi:DNA-binding MarR family transcriptional regulator
MSGTTGKTQFWPIVRTAAIALNGAYWPVIESAARVRGIESPAWQYLLYLLVFRGEPLSPVVMCVRGPYTSARLFEERFETLVRLGFLSRKGAGAEPGGVETTQYLPTNAGLSAARSLLNAAHAKMSELAPLPLTELERLATLLERVVHACLKPLAPLDGWCISHSMNLDPGPRAHVVARIDQYLSDMAAYRDDCHISSWKGHGIDGHAWEILTFVWRKQADSLDALHEKLKHRGFTQEETTQAVQGLLDRGWIEGTPVRYSATAVGTDVRQTAQNTTDTLFNAPFACLDDAERAELVGLLERLANVFQK